MKQSKLSIIGVLLIAFGSVLLLDRLDVIYFGWDRIIWMFAGIYGAILAVDGFTNKRRGKIFWGSLLFFASIVFSLYVWDVIWWMDYYWPSSLSLALGLAFLMLYLIEPKNIGVLVPAVLFCGFGGLMLLVEYYYIDWWDVRRVIRDYWPVALILWGIAILIRRRPQASS